MNHLKKKSLMLKKDKVSDVLDFRIASVAIIESQLYGLTWSFTILSPKFLAL